MSKEKNIVLMGKISTFVLTIWLPTLLWVIFGGIYFFSQIIWLVVVLGLMFHPVLVLAFNEKLYGGAGK